MEAVAVMSKLVFGKNGQVRFDSEEELKEAIDYIINSPNVNYNVHEDNQNQGAWGSEDRIHFYSSDDIPECLKRNMTAGNNGSIYGRINCKEFIEVIKTKAKENKKN